VDADLDTLATALYVRTDDLLKASPERVPWRPANGIAPRISDAELITLAVLQALLGHTSEARWLRYTTPTCGICSGTCPSNPATTSGCDGWVPPWAGWSGLSVPA
jgi:hypothetical protein